MRGAYLVALLLLALSCATDSGRARSVDASDTGSRIVLIAEEAPPIVAPAPVRPEPVEVSRAEYQAAMKRFARELRDKLRASQLATAEGFVFRMVGQARSVKVTGRILTVTLESNALRMANQGMSNGGGGSSRTSSPAPVASASKYRLRSIESWRKPRLTEDGRIKPYKDTQKPWRLIENKGRDRAGKTVTDGQSTIRFDKNGFPEFNTKFETILDDVHIGSGNPRAHRTACNENLFRSVKQDPSLAKDLGLSSEFVKALPNSSTPPPGDAWHHHQDVGRMQLVLLSEHRLAISHTGGMAIWGGGYSR